MLTGAKQERVKLEKVEKEKKERERKSRKKARGKARDSKWEKDATAEMRIRNGEITGQCKGGTRMGWEEEGKYSPVYYSL